MAADGKVVARHRRESDLLAADVVFYGDGGGKTVALPKPMYGWRSVALLLIGFATQVSASRPRSSPSR